jgi:hypothetical protein
MKTFLFILFFSILSVISQAQELTREKSFNSIKYNTVYISGGTFFVYNNALLNIERVIKNRPNNVFSSYRISIAGGVWETWGEASWVLLSKFLMLSGKQNSHFEWGVGLGYSPEYDTFLAPVGNIGYRYQKPNGWFVLRTGFGFPETIYLSGGVVF